MGNSKFAFKPNDEKIYVLTNGDNCDLIKIYNDFQECWDHYFYGLMKLYDDDGRKKEPNEIFIKHFWYGHKTFKDF